METSEAVPSTGVRAEDLAGLSEAGGPFSTLYLDTAPDVDNQAARSEVRWRNVRRDLEEAGTPAAVLDEIEQYVPDAHRFGAGFAAVATDAELLHVEHGPRPPVRDAGWRGPLPRLAGIVEWRQHALPHILVLVDRVGAEIVAVRPGLEDIVLESQGHDVQVTKVDPGGWSQRRYQQRAENFWNDNAKQTAELIARAADAADPVAIYVGGDVRAKSLLEDALREDLRGLVAEVTGGRDADWALEETEAQVSQMNESLADRLTVELLEHFEQERGQRDRAADGVAATLGALSAAQVDTLLLVADAGDERTAWCGSGPIPVAAQPGDLAALGVDDPVEAPLTDVLIRAAFGTGAGVRIVAAEAGVRDGVGAILRWS